MSRTVLAPAEAQELCLDQWNEWINEWMSSKEESITTISTEHVTSEIKQFDNYV